MTAAPKGQSLQYLAAGLAIVGVVGYYVWHRAHRHHVGPTIAAPADVAAPPPSALRTASGIAYAVLRPGTGTRHPTAFDTVSVHYTGWTTDGQMFDSSVTRGEPVEFPLDHVIPGWTEGVERMTEGEKVRFWIPGALAYDRPDHPAPPDAPHGMLCFDVELLRIVTP